MTQRILLVFGTRPEAIKMLPLAQVLRREPALDVRICVTAQHRQMLDQVLALFEVRPDHDLDIMTTAQGLEQITSAVLTGVARVLDEVCPDRVLVHGDTTTTLAASLAAFYRKIPVGHVEAGLRSGDPLQPWPEEINRRVTDVIADQFYAPTAQSRDNLLREGVSREKIVVTGNTVIDALHNVLAQIDRRSDLAADLASRFAFLDAGRAAGRRVLLVTGHRRENFGRPFEDLCTGIRTLAARGDLDVVYPVHLNPQVQGVVRRMLGETPHVHLIAPLDYLPFVALMRRASVILTDSGGVQEEAPALGKPVFVTRNVTERPEAVTAGTVRLVGTDPRCIVEKVSRVLDDAGHYAAMAQAHNPYGDGAASQRIADSLLGRPVREFVV